MAALINKLKNNRTIIFDIGRFDNYCVFVVEANGDKEAPLDVTYFTDFLNISRR